MLLFTRYGDDWTQQIPYLATRSDSGWTAPQRVYFAGSIYNATFGQADDTVIFATRHPQTDALTVFRTARTTTGWTSPENLTETYGLAGSYFTLLPDSTLWFHRDGDLYRTVGTLYNAHQKLPPQINTEAGTEFSQYVSPNQDLLIFARYTEGDSTMTGLFASRFADEAWTEPERLPLPYGWSPTLSPDGTHLIYTRNDRFVHVPLDALGLSR